MMFRDYLGALFALWSERTRARGSFAVSPAPTQPGPSSTEDEHGAGQRRAEEEAGERQRAWISGADRAQEEAGLRGGTRSGVS